MNGERMTPVDGHVHLHSVERAALTLDAAAANFRAVAGGGSDIAGVLLLTQARGERVFEALRARSACGQWSLRPVEGEAQSLLAEHSGCTVAIVCGRQIRCERGLEVTALGTTADFPDGLPLAESIREVQASGALCSLPWGFGKWTGGRGRVVEAALEQFSPALLAVCDNGGRLEILGRPPLVRHASVRGHRILPGTDPFPFGRDYRRAGAFGFLVQGSLEPDSPWRALRARLDARPGSPTPYGKALGPLRFVLNNVGIQLYNRRAQAARP